MTVKTKKRCCFKVLTCTKHSTQSLQRCPPCRHPRTKPSVLSRYCETQGQALNRGQRKYHGTTGCDGLWILSPTAAHAQGRATRQRCRPSGPQHHPVQTHKTEKHSHLISMSPTNLPHWNISVRNPPVWPSFKSIPMATYKDIIHKNTQMNKPRNFLTLNVYARTAFPKRKLRLHF